MKLEFTAEDKSFKERLKSRLAEITAEEKISEELELGNRLKGRIENINE